MKLVERQRGKAVYREGFGADDCDWQILVEFPDGREIWMPVVEFPLPSPEFREKLRQALLVKWLLKMPIATDRVQ